MSDPLDRTELCCIRIEHITKVNCIAGRLSIFTADGRMTHIPYGDHVEGRQAYKLIQEAMREAGNCWRIEEAGSE